MLKKTISIVLLSVLLTTPLPAVQPSGGDFVLTNSTVDSGGGVSGGGPFVLVGTVGQADAYPEIAVGGDFGLAGGFWPRVTGADRLFADGFE